MTWSITVVRALGNGKDIGTEEEVERRIIVRDDVAYPISVRS